jgi:hypothetical protein
VKIILKVEEKFKIRLSREIDGLRNVGDFVRLIAAQTNRPAGLSLRGRSLRSRSTIAWMLPMAVLPARWPIRSSSTGRDGTAALALLKCRATATPGVSNLSNGAPSVMMAAPSLTAGLDR